MCPGSMRSTTSIPSTSSRRWAGRWRAMPIPIAISSSRSGASEGHQGLSDMIYGGGISPGQLRRVLAAAASWRCIRGWRLYESGAIRDFPALLPFVSPSRRVGFVCKPLPRACSPWSTRHRCRPQLRLVWRLKGRLIERPFRGRCQARPAVDHHHGARTGLCEASANSSRDAAGRGRSGARPRPGGRVLQDRMPPFSQREAENAVGGRIGKEALRMCSWRSWPCRSPLPLPSPRSIAPRSKRLPGGALPLPSKVLRPGIEGRFKRVDSGRIRVRGPQCRTGCSGEARRLRLVEVVDTLARSVAPYRRWTLRLEASGVLRGWRKTPRTIRISASPKSIGTSPPAMC